MKLGLALLSLVTVTMNLTAQDLRRFDITAGAEIRNEAGAPLPGSNPDVTGDTSGCLVQILDVGANGAADLPALNGNPGGDDLIYTTTVIGKGIAPNLPASGRFATTVFPAPANGKRLFARVFDAPTVTTATRWGQSATFVVAGTAVMDVSVLGLEAATQTVGVNPMLVDTDGDGRSDFEELVANTNPLDEHDALQGGPLELEAGNAATVIEARAGRQYIMQRTDDLLSWQDVGATQSVMTGTSLWLQDPNPPGGLKGFYRVRVRMP
jgi:hypothetical protein